MGHLEISNMLPDGYTIEFLSPYRHRGAIGTLLEELISSCKKLCRERIDLAVLGSWMVRIEPLLR